jgi:hypothetical protein
LNILGLIVPIGFLIAGVYLFMLAVGPGETVQMIPGHQIPDSLAMMLGAIGLLGACVIGAEVFRAKKKRAPTDDRRRA